MALRRGEAWLTCATSDDAVVPALILAESLKRSGTCRRIGVIISGKVSNENRVVLRHSFHALFLVDESLVSGLSDEDQAKVFAFSLCVFDKCVFISPHSLILENADSLFEDNKSYKFLSDDDGKSIDLSCFLFTPCLDLCDYLATNIVINGKKLSYKHINAWFKSKHGGMMKIGYIDGSNVLSFSIKNGCLTKPKTHSNIIQFVDEDTSEDFVTQMAMLPTRNMGLPEKLILEKWLDILNQNVSARDHNTSITMKGEIYYNEPIAIVGMSCRYPGANNLEEFWNILYQGEEGIREPPAFRWTKEHSLRVSQQERKTNAGFLATTVDEFDARFFGVSPKEVAFMDPQARLLHEVVWESLEDSGIDPLSLHGTHTGIFTGSWMNDYKDIVQGSTERDFFRTYMGNSIGAAAARLSFLLGLTGPSIATESGCSSAIVALDLAVKSLRNGESTLALAGGVNLLLHPFTSNIMDYVIAPNGRCKTFDSKADGFGRAEGCGVLVLKRMSDALRDRDNIWALIRGSAVSQEGLSRSLGTPTVHCEALAMQLALEDANVNPSQVSFVETHGTGTAVGDPMEVAAIAKAYNSPDRQEPLIIGSVKTNVGHTESCSGITGIMKVILSMQHQLIPKHRNLDVMNPEVKLESIPAVLPLEPITWPKVTGQPRIAGVSSFGITGTDGHVIIEEAPDYKFPKFTLGLERPLHIMKISAKTSEALDDMMKSYEDVLENNASIGDGSENWADAAYTANVGRASFSHRAFVVGSSFNDAVKALKSGQQLRGEVTGSEPRKLAFLFSGQGSQYFGMAKSLYETSPIFHIHFDECDRYLKKIYNLSLRPVLWDSDLSTKELSRTIYSQTSIFCVEYCLLKLWESWGLEPDYVLGHSLGEFAAAVAAGILEFKDALKLVAERSRLIESLPRGSMLVIKASVEEVKKYIEVTHVDLDIAAVNSPDQTVVAGNTEDIQLFLEFCKGKGMKAIVLEATHAFHSRHMDQMLDQYRKVAETVVYKQGNAKCRYVSGMEGMILDCPSKINPDYWVRHTREKVSFVNACKALGQELCQDFIEVGPQPILSSFVMMNSDDVQLNCLPSLRRGTNDWQTILTTVGKLYLLGHKIDWKRFDETYSRNKVSLPFHPFHRKSFWVESNGTSAALIHPLVGYTMSNASNLHIFQNDLNMKSVPYLKDHCIGSRIVFPGAGYTEMCLTAGYCVANSLTETLEKPRRAISVENVRIDAPLELKEDKNCRLQVIVDLPEVTKDNQLDQQAFRVKVFHQTNSEEASGKWVLHASSAFVPAPATKEVLKKWKPERITELIQTNEPISAHPVYTRIDSSGLKFGETFKGITRHWNSRIGNEKKDEVVCEIKAPEDFNKYLLHPLIIDGMIQTALFTEMRYRDDYKLQVPVRIGKLTLFSTQDETKHVEGEEIAEKVDKDNYLYIHAWYEGNIINMFLVTQDLTPIAAMEDVEVVETTVKTIESILEQQTRSIPDSWEEIWKTIPGPNTDAIEIEKLLDLEALLSGNDFQEKLNSSPQVGPREKDIIDKTDRIIYLFILNSFYKLGWNPKPDEQFSVIDFCNTLGILPNFLKFVHYFFTIFHEEDKVMAFNDASNMWKITLLPPSQQQVQMEIEKLTEVLRVSHSSVVFNIYEHVYNKLTQILTGDESALAILFPTDESMLQYSADHLYQNYPGRIETVDKISHTLTTIVSEAQTNTLNKTSIYRVLEVGGGTGSLSLATLGKLKEIWGEKSFVYYFTDISPSFFTRAEKKLEEFKNNIKFAVFNIEESPLEQGIPLNYFDLVICTDVIHATRNLEESLGHLRQTLRNGTLCFTETLGDSRDITFIFGLLDGYWRMEDLDWRPNHCCVGENVWQQILPQCGFQSVHVTKTYGNRLGCISAQASQEVSIGDLVLPAGRASDDDAKEWVIFTTGDSAVNEVANILASSGSKVTAVFRTTDSIESYTNELNKKIVIRKVQPNGFDTRGILSSDKVRGIIYAWGMDIVEKEQKHISLPFLRIAQYILSLQKFPKLYILTQGVHSISDSIVSNPSAATLFGMAKSLKNENSELLVRYVDLEHENGTKRDQILWEIAMTKTTREFNRIQVAYRDNIRYEPRWNKANLLTSNDQLTLPQSTDRYHLALPKSRLINDLEFASLEPEPVAENEVEVKISCFSLNFRDIMAIWKPSLEFEKLNTVGLDFAGVISKVGTEVLRNKLKVGDRVFGASFKEAQLPSHLVLDASAMLKIPDNMTFCEAATLPAVFATSIYCFSTIARMKAGETVLIHTGSGGVGLAAIQLAKHIGATIITTAGNPRKRAYLRSLGIQHVFNSRNLSYGDEIMKVTNGRGVDIVLNSITGPGFKETSLGACAKNARFVEMSKLSIWTEEEVRALRPDVEYTVVDLTVLGHEKWGIILESLQGYLAERTIKPLPYVKYDALCIRQALQYFQKAKHIGKVVCVMPEVMYQEGHFQIQIPLFNSESTYLITGGLGGIGFEVGKWMLQKGATDIALVGRSAPNQEIAKQIDDLNGKGYNLMVKLGDVGNFDQCKAIIDDIAMNGKPLRGIQHCAGVLRDNMFANQTWESFDATFNAKVTGTWNLHNLTSNLALEHFVFYSSITALMGTPGQPNHAAANCFEDQFAHYRNSLGLPATTVNWGQWAQVGCAKEISLPGILPVSVKRMLNGLEVTLRTQRVQTSFGDFESLTMWSLLCPLVKSYFDDKILNKMKESGSNNQGLKAESFWKEMDDAEDKQEKINVVSVYLKRILRAALRLEDEEPINDDANIQDIGVDSLMLIELKNSIQGLFGKRLSITANLLKNCNTVRELANSLVGKLLSSDCDDSSVPSLSSEDIASLLTNDCQLDESIKVPQSGKGLVKPSEMKTLLVTGASGQLGPYILAEICKSFKSIEKIVCLIRTSGTTTPQSKLEKVLKSMGQYTEVDLSKIHCERGSVEVPNFGMEEEIYQRLCQSVDGVIHCAVKGNHVEPYRKFESETGSDIRNVNVGGTINVLKFAASSKAKHVYYASAYTSIFGVNASETLNDDWPQLNEIKVISENNVPGYQTSKYVCEMLMKEANARGVPCKVFRFPWITGNSQTGQLNYINNHYILRLLSYLKLKCMPSLAMPAIVLPVDTCAELSLKVFFDDEAPLEVYNIGHPDPQVEQEFVQLAKEFGVDVDVVEFKEFAEKLQNDSPLESLKELYTDVERVMGIYSSGAFQAIQGYINYPETYFKNNKVSKFIPNFDKSIESSMDIIRKNLNYVKSQGFFEKYNI